MVYEEDFEFEIENDYEPLCDGSQAGCDDKCMDCPCHVAEKGYNGRTTFVCSISGDVIWEE